MEKEKKRRSLTQKIARILLKTILFIFLFIVFVFLMILTPPVQRFLTGKVETYLQHKLKTKVEIGRISFGLSGNVNLSDVYIEDLAKDTLISGGTIKAHLNFLKLFSNEVQVKDLELQNITVRINRVLPDTVYNFQFIVDAFASEKSVSPDTSASAPLKLNISDITLDNINLNYKDVITGSDLFAHIGNLSATIDTLDPYTQHFDIPTVIARNVTARIKQVKPLVEPADLSTNISSAVQPVAMKLNLGTIDLDKINIQYDNDVSAFYTTINIGRLKTKEKLIDLQHNKIYLDEASMNNSKITIRLGKKQEAKLVSKKINQDVAVQKQAGWDFKIGQLHLDNNSIQFDNDNNPKLVKGMDYSHLVGDSLSLYVDNFVMNDDSIAGKITKGSVKEKSGFHLQDLRGDVLYSSDETYLKNIYIKTPGSEIQKNASMHYASIDDLSKNFAKTVFDLELTNSRLQVKDILVFAPQLSSNAALSNPNDTWFLNIVGNGTLDRLYFESLQFNGLRNTELNAKGTLVGLTNPKKAGGDFTIYRLRTTQSDLALFTGQRLSTPQLNLPESFDINGTVKGNAGNLYTNLNIATSSGFVSWKGQLSNIANPSAVVYNGVVRANALQLGTIMRQPETIGSVTGVFTLNGKGFTPDAINTKFTGDISSLGYNKYQYHNIHVNGSLQRTLFDINAAVKDPNADLHLVASGNFSKNPSFKINGMIDSVNLQALHFTPDPAIFRGKIDGTVSNISSDNMDANVMITKALFVSGDYRLPLDTVQLISGRNDTANFLRFRSDIANAYISGQYRLADLGSIIQNSIQPYFSIASVASKPSIKPYNFNFTADVVYSPILSAFVPGLTSMQPLHAEGNFVTNGGMNAELTSPSIVYNGNEISQLDIKANTTDKGLQITSNIARVKNGSSFDIFNARVNATALNNNIDFSVGIDDQNAKNKYHLSGLITQPSTGTYAIKLKPDSLLLNYEAWTVTPDNLITIDPTHLTANNFVLQKGAQRLTVNSAGNAGANGIQPLEISFNDFKVSTLTGFVKSDSLLVDGTINGNISFVNPLQQLVFTSDLTINDLSFRQDTVGNLHLQVKTSGDNYITDATISGRGNDVALTGSFTPAGSNVNLDLDLDVRQLQLKTMEGAMAGMITNSSGAVNGKIKIGGSASAPMINGDLNFDKASFALAMLGSQFKIDNEKIALTENGFVFDNFAVKDSANNTLTVDGTVLTSNFTNYNFNLDIASTDFQVLDSKKAKGSIYYGKLNITSKLHVAGTEIKPVVDGSLTVNKGTDLAIVVPQTERGVEERDGIVQFVDMRAPENDSLFRRYDSLNFSTVLGLDLAVNIEIKKEAIFNVIIDEANGDFLNVRGEAQLSAGIDPSGKVTLVGNYSLEEGSYQLSFNFLQRKFDIQKGSTITWTGEPTTAQLNVTAVYVANTAPLDLVGDQISAPSTAIRNTYLQKLPFEVHLNLTGELLKPVISFDILLPENKNYGVSNDIVTAVQTRLDQIRQDQGEINKQVFALLLLGRFVGENPFKSSGEGFNAGSYARESVSKLLTEQLNTLAAGLINGVDLNFDVVSSEDYTTGSRQDRTDVNVGLSKRLLSDRLKITVGSDFQLQGPQNSNQSNNNIAGNIAADYQLSRDGRYVLRFYRKNQYEGVVDGYIIETGVGFILSIDYNRFKNIIHPRKNKVTSTGTTQNPTKQ